MSMSQLQQTMATLRMSLAELNNREQQLDSMISQFRTQLRRLPRAGHLWPDAAGRFPILNGGD